MTNIDHILNGYPKDLALEIAKDTVEKYIEDGSKMEDAWFIEYKAL